MEYILQNFYLIAGLIWIKNCVSRKFCCHNSVQTGFQGYLHSFSWVIAIQLSRTCSLILVFFNWRFSEIKFTSSYISFPMLGFLIYSKHSQGSDVSWCLTQLGHCLGKITWMFYLDDCFFFFLFLSWSEGKRGLVPSKQPNFYCPD